jgi:tetratricopeptide (TPR) repeat protein
VVTAVGVVLTQEEEARIEAIPTQNLGAYEAFLLGQYHYERRDDLAGATAEAVRFLRLAIQQDPDLAVAHATLAGTYVLMASIGAYDPREMWPQVEEWARSALAIDSTSATAVLMLAKSEWHQNWDWEEAERGIRRAIQLSPSDAYGHQMYARLLVDQGRIVEGMEEGRIAASLDPLSSHTLSSQARRAFHTRRYEEAHRLAEVLLRRDPDNAGARRHLGLCFLFGGHPEQFRRLFPEGSSGRTLWHALIRGIAGEADAARGEIERAVSSAGDRYFNLPTVWATYAGLGEKDEAFAWIERSIEAQTTQISHLGVSPLADPLRDDPRYQAILDRIGLGHLKERFDSLAAADPRRAR